MSGREPRKLVEVYKEFLSKRNRLSRDDLDSEAAWELATTVVKEFTVAYRLEEKIELQKLDLRASRSGSNTTSWMTPLVQLVKSHNSKFAALQESENELSYASKIEFQAYIRATFFRVLTTGLVGLTVLGIYALGYYFEIPMPLGKMPS